MIEQREIDRLRRHLVAFSAKANDPEAFAVMVSLADEFNRLLAEQARILTTIGNPKPHTWADIARPLGISRQAAHKRYARSESR